MLSYPCCWPVSHLQGCCYAFVSLLLNKHTLGETIVWALAHSLALPRIFRELRAGATCVV